MEPTRRSIARSDPLAAAFRSAYDICGYPGWIRYGEEPVPPPALAAEDQAWLSEWLGKSAKN